MAASTLLTLIDDIATLLDDIATMSKVAVKKTAGVLGDDLALNAQQVTGISAKRELPVVWKVAQGSLLNKAILVPAALAISAFLPQAITPLLMLGGLYLCFEGVEKIAHKFLHHEESPEEKQRARVEAIANPKTNMVAFEKGRIRGAIRTDFILSAEIIVITLGTVADQSFTLQLGVLVAISLLITVGVYGLVAGIVKMDDLGRYLYEDGAATGETNWKSSLGGFLLALAPWLMKFLSIAGTIAMFLVGGGILVHGIPPLYKLLHHWVEPLKDLPVAGNVASWLGTATLDGLFGILCGSVALVVFELVMKFWKKPDAEVPQAHN